MGHLMPGDQRAELIRISVIVFRWNHESPCVKQRPEDARHGPVKRNGKGQEATLDWLLIILQSCQQGMQERPMRNLHAFGSTRRPGGVDHICGMVEPLSRPHHVCIVRLSPSCE